VKSLNGPSDIAEVTAEFILYRGRRMLVINNVSRVVDEDFDVVVWDKALECAVGFCSQSQDGSFEGFVAYGPHELPIAGPDARELAQDALKSVNWTLNR
jgi:hypothetical protein